jgi:hypothetical protein
MTIGWIVVDRIGAVEILKESVPADQALLAQRNPVLPVELSGVLELLAPTL